MLKTGEMLKKNLIVFNISPVLSTFSIKYA